MKKLVYVTGAGRGIGRAISLILANKGYMVAGCSRSMAELQETKKLSEDRVFVQTVDVRDSEALDSWMATAETATGAKAWGLVTAAGVYGPIGSFLENSWEDWKQSLDINLYGTALACRSFAKLLVAKKAPGRIILMSGGGATQPLPRFTSYCASKAAVVRFGETLALELLEQQITVNSLAPGAVNTKLTEDIIQAGPEKAGKEMYAKALKQMEDGGANPQKAGDLTDYLLSDAAAGVTGRLLSAIWDPWQTLHEKSDALRKSDIYTLRRIVPEDRP